MGHGIVHIVHTLRLVFIRVYIKHITNDASCFSSFIDKHSVSNN